MAAEGQNKVASSLLDLQPTAVLELFRVYPDRISQPSLFLGFHGGSIFDKAITWQGVKYLPLAVESEGFDILGDGKLPRPKIRVANQNHIITNLLQNHDDFKNAKVIRKKVSVKFLDDSNFDGGNPFGLADPKAELSNETWIMGRKTQESKVFVEFELNSPLDLESFSVNARSVVAKFCPWQYRGQGCRYQGFPIEREDGLSFQDNGKTGIVPNYDYKDPNSPIDFFFDPAAEWNSTQYYQQGNISIITNPQVTLPPLDGDITSSGDPLKTVFVCVQANSGQAPENNPSYWQKDGCTKRLQACKKRFNPASDAVFVAGQNVNTGFSYIALSGGPDLIGEFYNGTITRPLPQNTGLFHTHATEITGKLTGDFTLIGWANVLDSSPLGAGVFSTTERDAGSLPNMQFININSQIQGATNTNVGQARGFIGANWMGAQKNHKNQLNLNALQSAESAEQKEWAMYTVTHETGVQPTAWGGGVDYDTLIKVYVNNEEQSYFRGSWRGSINATLGNFCSLANRDDSELRWTGPNGPVYGFPRTFMLGAVEQFYTTNSHADIAAYGSYSKVTSIRGGIGPWALWNRALTPQEMQYLYKEITPPNLVQGVLNYAPRSYYECSGEMGTITGSGNATLPHATDSLIAWWDGSTGLIPSTRKTGMLDIHTGGFHLTGSGIFNGETQTYAEGPRFLVPNPTPTNPRFGGFPGTDGFSYGRTTQL